MSACTTASRAGVVALVAVLAAAPVRGQSLIKSGSTTDASFDSAHKFHLQYASGRYWSALRDTGCSSSGRIRLYSSADGSTWSEAPGSPVFPAFCPSYGRWAVRFLGDVIVAFAYNDSDTRRYYSKGTLAADGTVTWQKQQDATGLPTGATDNMLNAAIVNGKPVLWAADEGSPGRVSIGSSLDSPTWTTVVNTTALNASIGTQYGTNGVFSAGAVFPLHDVDPNDFIVIRATSRTTYTAQAHRVVSIKYDASAGTFDSSWFNVSTSGNGVTLTEDATTETWVSSSGDSGFQARFAATQQPDGIIHVVYVNRNGDVVHYRRAPGAIDQTVSLATYKYNGWVKVSGDSYTGDNADGEAAAVGKVGLTVVDDNNLFLSYVLNPEPETTVYSRRWEGRGIWSASTAIAVGGSGDVNYALGTMETATGCKAGLAWNQDTGPYDVYFRVVNPSCTAPTLYLRSIGTAADYTTGQATVANGSKAVSGVGTAWLTANRGMGDALVVPCPDPPTCTGGTAYVIASIQSETRVTLTAPFAGTEGTYSYAIRRQFQSAAGNAAPALIAWEDCIDGGTACPYFTPTSASLVADNRVEVGVLYKDSVIQPADGSNGGVTIRDARTSGTHRILLTVAPGNRHDGVPAAAGCTTDCSSVVYQGSRTTTAATNGLQIWVPNVTVEWIEFRGFGGGASSASYGPVAIVARTATQGAQNVLIDHLLVHDYADTDSTTSWSAIRGHEYCCKTVAVRNTMVWDGDLMGISGDEPGDTYRVENCTVDSMHGTVTDSTWYGVSVDESVVTVRNTIATVSGGREFFHYSSNAGGFATDGTTNYTANNTSSGPTAPGPNAQTSVAAAALFVAAGSDLHLKSGAVAIDQGLDLASSMSAIDVDGQVRLSGAWDRGADEFAGTTAVRLMGFEAAGGDGAVELWWQTGSELDNLGFHLYRSLSEAGPWARLTSSLIPGLGSSAVGRTYTWQDAGLLNGTRYYYRLEDVDASSVSTFHGPVSAVPVAAPVSAPSLPGEDGEGDAGGGGAERGGPGISSSCPTWLLAAAPDVLFPTCTRHGAPESVSLDVLARDSSSATVELRTGGFWALHEGSGLVRVFVRGFELPSDPRAAALPLRRVLVDAVVGRGVALEAVRVRDEVGFGALVPTSVGEPEMRVGWNGTVVAGRREVGRPQSLTRSPVRLLPSVFQGERKSAVVEISPLRVEGATGEVRLARSVVVRLGFRGREAGEVGRGSVGRARPVGRASGGEVLARLYTTRLGLHAVSFESLFPGRRRSVAVRSLSLQRQGRAQAFHVEPWGETFGPGSRLYFHADTVSGSTEFSSETAWELVRWARGVPMPLRAAAPGGDEVTSGSTGQASFERNRVYLPGLVEAQDPWLWEPVVERATKAVGFSLAGVDGSPGGSAEVEVFLQGGSESGGEVDHHVAVSVNGAFAGEAEFAGKTPYRMRVRVPACLLREGDNELSVTNVGDTGVFSYVYLDRIVVGFPQRSSMGGGVFEGSWGEGGTVSVGGVAGRAAVVDVTTSPAVWLTGAIGGAGAVRFRAEAGHRYLAVTEAGLLAPRVVVPTNPAELRSTTNQAEYIVIGPRAFLGAAEPLVERRRDEGLSSRAVALEQIAEEFGHGQASGEAIRNFLAYAFHAWSRPSPRYVLLLGDSSYDPRNFSGSSPASALPALWKKTSYLLTVSDPELAAVNGEDSLADLAIGRLPAGTVEEVEGLVAKVLAWEETGGRLGGRVALVADDSDLAGDFEGAVADVARSFLAGRAVETLKVGELGRGTREAIREALDSGLGLMSYVGHGGAAVWASENVWNTWDAPSLAAQSEQPVLLTLNCLNGYFVGPAVDSLSESLVKARGRGAVAAVSPSGLSLDGPAHALHRALVAELAGGGHERLGDAVMAAQAAYARSGLMPELLSVYHLLGDPALKIR